MTDTKELILSLSQAIKHSDWGSVSLHVKTAKEIKERLEQQAQPKEEPDEELVEKIWGICMNHASYAGAEGYKKQNDERRSVAKAEIRSLLQSRQRSKPKITREEIETEISIIYSGFKCSELRLRSAVDMMAECYKSKGVEVGE